MVASLRPYSFAKQWSKMGHDVTVLALKYKEHPNDLKLPLDGLTMRYLQYPKIAQNLLDSIKTKQADSQQKTLVKPKQSKSGLVNQLRGKYGILQTTRMPDHSDLLYRSGYKTVHNENWDVVVSSYGPYINHLIALKLKKKNKTKLWVADYRDLWTQNHYYPGLFPFKIIEEYFDKKIINTADIVTSISDPCVNQIKRKYQIDNAFTITNGFDPEDQNSSRNICSNIIDKNKINIVYTGSFYKKLQDPSPLFQAISEIKTSKDTNLLSDLVVSFIGKEVDQLSGPIRTYAVGDWIRCFAPVSRDEILAIQRDAHVLLFLDTEQKEDDGVLPGKLFEYMFSGTEIWGLGIKANCSSGKMILTTKSGETFGTDVDLIKSRLIDLLKRKQKKNPNPDSEYLSQFTREFQAKKLLKLIADAYDKT